ncbi:peptide/nickel transport system substrate-binding protein [Pseudonocardia thermophila]|uniref:Peptide/nickel transport system substrate-binding protein n=1 Tax=Pseudonocardia thermophila TaxID=1848 RepID=A0A1M6T1U1_PSETH|nr:ABC transporter substrate-binding protein [Pseudonocardia thermophila]SHK50887.1 peptide/nickel transport system substrate-binding protein [Pseudonocardia thermophila]
MTPLSSRAFALLAAVVLAVVPAACGSSASGGADGDPRGRLKVGAAAIPSSLDPRKSAPYEAQWIGMLYDTLIQRAPDGTFEPALAESWTLSDDGLVLDLTLRAGVTFQDGAPFDAAAVKANLDAAKAGGTNFSAQLADVESVEVVDDRHVRLRMARAAAPMLGVLAGEAGMIINPARLGDDLSRAGAGAGPFKLDKFEGPRLEFTAWDGYWNADAVKVSGVDIDVFIDDSARLRALRSRQLDTAFVIPAQVREVEASGLTLLRPAIAESFWGVLVNTGRRELADPRVRKAMMLALDREALARNVFGESGCTPSAQPFDPKDWAYSAAIEELPEVQHDPGWARQLLAEAGLPNGFSIELQVGTAQNYTQIGQILQSQWGAIGITVNLRPMENVQFVTARRNGEFDATVSVYLNARPDQSVFVQNFLLPGGIFNPGGYDQPGTAELLARSSSSFDPTVRGRAMHELMTAVLTSGPPIMPICTAPRLAAHRDTVEDLDMTLDTKFVGVGVTTA